MPRPFSHRWADTVTRRWPWVLAAWLVVTITIRMVAPAWKDIAYDGDFEYLPADMSSVAAGQLMEEAFPGLRSRSQVVLILGRQQQSLTKRDDVVGLDLLRRLYHRLSEVSWQRAIEYGYQSGPIEKAGKAAPWLQLTKDSLDRAIALDERFYERIINEVPEIEPNLREPRMAIAHWDRGKLLELISDSEEAVEFDFLAALTLLPDIPLIAEPIDQRELEPWQSLIDLMSWDDTMIGARLSSDNARLAVLQLSSELAATGNIATIESVQQLIEEVVAYSAHYTDPGLKLAMTGSAAIGGETLIAARDAIRYTEWISLAMILVILAGVYRAPLLIAVPVVSIGVAVVVSISLVALLTRWSIDGTVPGLDLRVFTTSRIFVVVILFGAGTDYCLFLISRLREEAIKAPWPVACRNALSGVSGALMGSALTTVVGLGMLWIASFGKFHYTGPIIAICLLVGLLTCMTLTPALLRALGPRVFWPAKIQPAAPTLTLLGDSAASRSGTMGGGAWGWIALMLTRRPAVALLLGLSLLAMPGIYGLMSEDSVTYDLSSQLSHNASSRKGLRLLSKNFEIGQFNAVTALLVRPTATPREEFEQQIKDLSDEIYTLEGVTAVRNSSDPLGDFPPGRKTGLFQGDAWRRRALQHLSVAQDYFFSDNPKFKDRLARLDVIVEGDPFAITTGQLVTQLDDFLRGKADQGGSKWEGSNVYLAGTTPSISDLRRVTLSDGRRIKLAVVVAVFAVLVIIIRRVGLCIYLIATVLLSYYATLGLTILFFRESYGADFVGLDWKLPLFLFVILVAVGQDYNVYLVTRIWEEQQSLGWLAALRRAVSRTGGIITACGLVMAATFFSMTASAWFPMLAELFGGKGAESRLGLRGIVELGFALGLGVLIDTFYVRTILVPSFVALVGQRSAKENSR